MVWKGVDSIKHIGDITKIDGSKIEPVWVITGGSPCQDLSVAGKRAGLKHSSLGDDETTRSGLFMEQIRIIKEMREHEKANGRSGQYVRCRWSVWENVCGALSSNNGCDFFAVLEEFVHIADPEATIPRPTEVKGNLKWEKSGVIIGDKYSLAWRVHDAQYFGVPQRRRRICVLTDFSGHTAPDLLMEYIGNAKSADRKQTVMDIGRKRRLEIQSQSDSLFGNTQTSSETREGTAGDVEKSVGEDGGDLDGF